MLVCASPIANLLEGVSSRSFFNFCLYVHWVDVYQVSEQAETQKMTCHWHLPTDQQIDQHIEEQFGQSVAGKASSKQ
jgi:hypothetical protein